MIKLSEIFYSIQGEGKYTGCASLFFRFWKCNLHCAGFGQDDPTDESTYDLTFRDYDPLENKIESYEDLPIFGKGCDSEYSHNPKYQYLLKSMETEEACNAMLDLLPNREWGSIHWVITGGEAMLNQRAIVSMMLHFKKIDNFPSNITIETNGTQRMTQDFHREWESIQRDAFSSVKLSFSVSYKLFNVTGEVHDKAVKPEIVNDYAHCGEVWLKPVVVDTEACWDELDLTLAEFKSNRQLHNVPVYVMPCGATQEEQEQDGYMARIAGKALDRGHNFSIRAHVFIWGNSTGT